jgi:CBS domain-containing protein
VADILATKEPRLLTIDADASVLEAARRMIDENVGSMLVSVRGRTVGIVTEHD